MHSESMLSLPLGGLTYGQALGVLLASQLAGALYLHSLTRRTSPGLSRFLAALPVIILNLAAPLLFTRATDPTTIASLSICAKEKGARSLGNLNSTLYNMFLFHLPSRSMQVLASFNTAWLSNFKVLLWALNRSSLASPDLNPSQFTAMLVAPLTPVSEAGPRRRGRLAEAAAPPLEMLRTGAIKMMALGIIAKMLQTPDLFHPVLRAFLYGLALYTLLSSLMDGPGALASQWLGVPVSPHFDTPWMSSSISSFWNQRWDLAAGNALRQLIDDPLMEGKLVGAPPTLAAQVAGLVVGTLAAAGAVATTAGKDFKEKERKSYRKSTDVGKKQPAKRDDTSSGGAALGVSRPQQWRQFLGSFLAFLTSGLVHECIFWYLTGHTSGGMWLMFFLVQVPVGVVERIMLRMLRRHGLTPPLPLMVLYTVGFQCVVSSIFFWGPAERAGLVGRVIGNVEMAYATLVESLMKNAAGPALHWINTALVRMQMASPKAY